MSEQHRVIETQGKDVEEAIETGPSVFRISGRHPLALATSIIAHVKAGKGQIAEALWAELQARARTEWVQSFWLAAVEGMIGDRDRAMALAFRAVEERDPFAIAAKTWPHWEALRSHPEFPTLLEKLGLA